MEQFFKNKRITGGTFSPDGSRLLVTSNESGIMNLHEITVANGPSRQITSSTLESLVAVDYVFGTGEILYFADQVTLVKMKIIHLSGIQKLNGIGDG